MLQENYLNYESGKTINVKQNKSLSIYIYMTKDCSNRKNAPPRSITMKNHWICRFRHNICVIIIIVLIKINPKWCKLLVSTLETIVNYPTKSFITETEKSFSLLVDLGKSLLVIVSRSFDQLTQYRGNWLGKICSNDISLELCNKLRNIYKRDCKSRVTSVLRTVVKRDPCILPCFG